MKLHIDRRPVGAKTGQSDAERAAWCRDVDPALLAQAERAIAAELAPAPVKQTPTNPRVRAWAQATGLRRE